MPKKYYICNLLLTVQKQFSSAWNNYVLQYQQKKTVTSSEILSEKCRKVEQIKEVIIIIVIIMLVTKEHHYWAPGLYIYFSNEKFDCLWLAYEGDFSHDTV